MAEKVIDLTLKNTDLPFVKCNTFNLKIKNGLSNIDFSKESLSDDFFLTKEMIIHYVENEIRSDRVHTGLNQIARVVVRLFGFIHV